MDGRIQYHSMDFNSSLKILFDVAAQFQQSGLLVSGNADGSSAASAKREQWCRIGSGNMSVLPHAVRTRRPRSQQKRMQTETEGANLLA